MPISSLRRLALFALVCCGVAVATIGITAAPVAAHNTLLSSDPADGATLPSAPSEIVWDFDNTVPLDSMTVTLIDAAGVRSELTGSTHGAAGDHQIITPLPEIDGGEVSLRWRLVGADGHPITGRVDFVVAAEVAAVTPGETAPDVTSDDAPAAVEPPPAATSDDDFSEFSTPSAIRWVLRYTSYLSIMAVVGIVLLSAVWSGAGTNPLLRRILSGALLATAALGAVQLSVIASDIAAAPPWAAFDKLDPALATTAGAAFAVRVVIAVAMWLLLFRTDTSHPDVYWSAVSLPGLGLLATWAFAGHSASMRWPTLGVLTDVLHHAAAAVWIAGLAIVGWIAIPTLRSDELVAVVRRFSVVAAVSVAVLVVTGLVQTVRLVGGLGDLFVADHGRYLAVKVAVLAAMLALANVNRRRVHGRLDDTDTVHEHVGPLRRAMLAEFAIGLIIVAVTAAMVVSPPATNDVARASAADQTAVYYEP